MTKKLLGCLLLALLTLRAMGQATPAAPALTEPWQTTFFESPATTLPILTAAAVKHSAQLKALEITKTINQQDIKLAKKSILGIVAVNGNYNYGNLASIASDPKNPTQFGTANAGRYSVGVGVGLGLDRVVSRGNTIRREVLNLAHSEALREDQENQVRVQVIQAYQGVLLAKKLLTFRQETFVNTQSTYQLAEKQFRRNQMTLQDFSQATAQLTDATVSQETGRSQYETSFMLLEELVGNKISSLLAASR